MEAPDLSLQHVCCYFDNDDDVIVVVVVVVVIVVVVVVVVAGGWTMLDNCCLHSHFTFAILFQALVSESTTSAVSINNHMFGFCSCHEYSFGKISLFCSFLSIYYHRQQDTVTASAQQQDGSSTCKTRRSRGSKMRWQYWQDKRCH